MALRMLNQLERQPIKQRTRPRLSQCQTLRQRLEPLRAAVSTRLVQSPLSNRLDGVQMYDLGGAIQLLK